MRDVTSKNKVKSNLRNYFWVSQQLVRVRSKFTKFSVLVLPETSLKTLPVSALASKLLKPLPSKVFVQSHFDFS